MEQNNRAERLRELLERLVEDLQVEGTVGVVETDDAITGTVEGDDLAVFIGRHGQTIEAVQHLAQRILLNDLSPDEPRPRIVVDAGGYRERRREALMKEADQAAIDVEEYGRPVALDAMTSSERKIVHEYLRDRGGVETHSEGEEPDRHLVISALSAAPSDS